MVAIVSESVKKITQEVTDNIKQDQQEIVLEARLNTKTGGIRWTIPQDLRIACYLLKILDTAIVNMLSMTLRSAVEKIKKPYFKIF